MNPRIYHGTIQPNDIARNLIAHFDRGSYHVQQVGSGDQIAVQIATSAQPLSGGATALSITLQKVEDGVAVMIGSQPWMGIAASLGTSALAALRNPFSLLGRLDDIAQDIESLQLTEEVWKVIDLTSRAAGASFELSERLRRMVCGYCLTANPVGEPSCIACGAPLGEEQPGTCKQCGFVLVYKERVCPNCGKPVR